MKYYANFRANDNTSFIKPIEGTNKYKLRNEIRAIAEGERFLGQDAAFGVWHTNDNGDDVHDFCGRILPNGQIVYDREYEGQVIKL